MHVNIKIKNTYEGHVVGKALLEIIFEIYVANLRQASL